MDTNDIESMVEESLRACIDRPVALINKRCIIPPIGCGEPVCDFRDDLSLREYQITGLCQACQDKVYNPDGECTCDRPCCQADIGIGVIDCGSQHCPIHGIKEEG